VSEGRKGSDPRHPSRRRGPQPQEGSTGFWLLDPEVAFLNHGSFGACPRPILDHQAGLRARMEREPVLFLWKELEGLWDEARTDLAAFVGCGPEGLVFVNNASTGVNTILASFPLSRGDEVLVTDHEYNACRNALDAAAARSGATVVLAPVPFPLTSPDEVVEAIVKRVSQRTRLLLVDHITSQTGMVFPVGEIVREMARRGVETLVDGAHGPGQVPLRIDSLGAAFYTGNCHKWLCAPKGAAFLYVREDWRDRVRPLVVSHGANTPRTDRSRFLMEFDWTGTDDPTAVLCVPECIHLLGALCEGGWQELMDANRALALQARTALCAHLGIGSPCPDSMVGSMAAFPLPEGVPGALAPPLYLDPLQEHLWERFRIEVPVQAWPAPPKRVLRISAQVYNSPEQYSRLAGALGELGVP
jgi:isopenicillin-N epimerase